MNTVSMRRLAPVFLISILIVASCGTLTKVETDTMLKNNEWRQILANDLVIKSTHGVEYGIFLEDFVHETHRKMDYEEWYVGFRSYKRIPDAARLVFLLNDGSEVLLGCNTLNKVGGSGDQGVRYTALFDISPVELDRLIYTGIKNIRISAGMGMSYEEFHDLLGSRGSKVQKYFLSARKTIIRRRDNGPHPRNKLF